MAEDLQYAINLTRSGKSADALRILKDICNKQPNDPNGWAWQGLLHAQHGSYLEAEHCIKRSIELQPDNPMAYRTLGDVFSMQRKFSNAIDAYHKSLSIKPDQAEILSNLFKCMIELNRIQEAIDIGLAGLELEPQQPLRHRDLGLLYDLLNRTDEARIHANAAIKLNPADIESHILLATLDSREGKYDAAKRRLQEQFDASPTELQKAKLHLELGMILDRVSDYREAFQYISSGNALLAKVHGITPQSTAKYRADIDRYKRYFTPDCVRHWLSDPLPEHPNRVIFLVGFPRSGTTLTEQILESHDRVVATNELPALTDIIRDAEVILGKKYSYPEDTEHLIDRDISTLRTAYLNNIKHGVSTCISEESIILDKMPLNIVHLGFIARIFPEARIIVALRDPRDVCLSCYMQSFQVNIAMAQFLDLEDTGRFYACVMGMWQHYKKIEDLPVHVSRYEDVVDDLEISARHLLDFCNLEWNEKILEFHTQEKQRLVRTPSYQAISSPIYRSSIGKWRNYTNELQPIMAYLDPFIDAFNYQAR